MTDNYHFRLGLSHELWNELLKAALPIKITEGEFHLTRNARDALRQLQIRQRVAGLLEDRRPPQALVRVKDRAKRSWTNRKEGIYRRLGQLVRVQGTWRVELDELGTQLTYGTQRVAADAFVKSVAEGKVYLLKENIEFPFTIEKRVGASVALGDIHYDKRQEKVIGSLQDLGVHLGDNVILQLLGRLAEYALEQQLPRANPVPILKRAQVEDMVKPLGDPLNMNLGVEDLQLQVDGTDVWLKVRFGFSQAQLTGSDKNVDRLEG